MDYLLKIEDFFKFVFYIIQFIYVLPILLFEEYCEQGNLLTLFSAFIVAIAIWCGSLIGIIMVLQSLSGN